MANEPFLSGDGAPVVYASGNTIFLEDEINDRTVGAVKLLFEALRANNPPRVLLSICSGGGEVYPALSLVGYIKNYPFPIDSLSTGIAASAATLIAIVCQRRYMHADSHWMIHQASGMTWGKADEIQDAAKSLAMLEDIMVRLYSNKKVKEKTLRALLTRDTYLTAQEAFDYGFVDEIL